LFILIEKRRINLFKPIVDYYIDLVNKLNLVTLATVYTVVPLNDEQKEDLQNKLKSLTKSQLVQLVINIKPDLIGGFVVKIGSKIIDMSIYGQLNQISSYLNATYV
jgi:F-type H+-transporting ATPase subunit delta